jgi:uncharacterized protein (DUF433 family)
MATSEAKKCYASKRLSFDPLSVPLKQLDSGVVRVGGTRVSLDSVIYCFRQGDTPEIIADAFSALNVEDVRAVIAYYLSNGAEVDEYLRIEEEASEAMRREHERDWDATGFKEKMMERWEEFKRQRDAAAQ